MKLSAAQTTREEDGRGLYQAVGAGLARLRLLADLNRDLRGPLDERGVWEVALRHAGQFCTTAQGWALDPQGRVLLGPGEQLPETWPWTPQAPDFGTCAAEAGPAGPQSSDAGPVDAASVEAASKSEAGIAAPQTEFRRRGDGAAFRVPVCAGRQWLGTLVLVGVPEGRVPDTEDLTALDVLGAQVGAAAQLLRLSAELTRSSRQVRHLRREELRARAGRLDPRIDLGGTPLTAREREVLTLVARGLSNPEIGAALGIRAGTAKIHVERILSKLGVPDRTGAAVLGLSLGLIEP